MQMLFTLRFEILKKKNLEFRYFASFRGQLLMNMHGVAEGKNGEETITKIHVQLFIALFQEITTPFCIFNYFFFFYFIALNFRFIFKFFKILVWNKWLVLKNIMKNTEKKTRKSYSKLKDAYMALCWTSGLWCISNGRTKK